MPNLGMKGDHTRVDTPLSPGPNLNMNKSVKRGAEEPSSSPPKKPKAEIRRVCVKGTKVSLLIVWLFAYSDVYAIGGTRGHYPV